jgi:peptide deformylase
MSKIQLVIAPDPLLNLRSREVMKAEMTDQMREFIQNMLDALYSDQASGYALS